MTGGPCGPKRPPPPVPGGELDRPGQRELLDRRLVDLRQRAVALAGVVAGVRRPAVAERLEEIGRGEVAGQAGLAGRQGPGDDEGRERNEYASVSFEGHQVGGDVVHVGVGQHAEQRAMLRQRILHVDLRGGAGAADGALACRRRGPASRGSRRDGRGGRRASRRRPASRWRSPAWSAAAGRRGGRRAAAPRRRTPTCSAAPSGWPRASRGPAGHRSASGSSRTGRRRTSGRPWRRRPGCSARSPDRAADRPGWCPAPAGCAATRRWP